MDRGKIKFRAMALAILIFAALTATVLPAVLRAEQIKPLTAPTARDIIARMAEKAKLIEDLRATMVSNRGGGRQPRKSIYEFKQPCYFRWETTSGGNRQIQRSIVLLNDEGYWQWTPERDEAFRLGLPSVSLFYFPWGTLLNFSLAPQRIAGEAAKLNYLGEEKINGKKAYVIEIIPRKPDRPSRDYSPKLKLWIETVHLSLLKIETNYNKQFTAETVATRFQEVVPDFYLPVSWEATSSPRGFVTISRLENIEINPGILKERFALKLSGNTLIRDGEPLSADEYIEKLKTDPDNANLHYNLGFIYLREARNPEKAIQEFKKVVELKPNSKAGYSNLGWAYERVQEYEGAINLYKEATERFPDYIGFHEQLARAYERQEEYDLAIRQYRKVIELRPDDYRSKIQLARLLGNQGKGKEAIRIYKDILKSDLWTADRAQGQAGAGLIALYQKENRLEELLGEYQALVKAKPDAPYISRTLGDIYLKLGKKEKALAAYRKAMLQQPKDDQLRLSIARILTREKAYPEAEKLYRQVINNAGSSWPAEQAQRELIRIYMMTNQGEKAIGYYSEALKTSKNIREWELAFREQIRFYEEKGQLNELVSIIRKKIEENPQNSRLYALLAGIYSRQRNYKEAISQYKKAIALSPKETNLYRSLAWMYERAKMYEEAIKSYSKAIELDPQSLYLYQQLAFIYIRLGRDEEALKTAQILLEKGSQDADTYSMVAQIYRNMKRDKEAISYYRKAIELASKSKTRFPRGRESANEPKFRYQLALAQVYEERGKDAEAEKEYTQIIAESKSKWITGRAQERLFNIYRKTGRLEQVAHQYETELAATEAKSLSLYKSLGARYRRQGEYEKALKMYKKAFALAPQDEEINRILKELEQTEEKTE
ncbi:MAG: tetratricopeptide repeat protein [Nitrospirae bacterium]|nr:tetratricopeptide repeat protein [Nitrospirota bacterium]